MKARSIATLTALALAAAIAPLPTLAANGSAAYYDLATRQYDEMRAGEYDSRMRLQIAPDGIVNGTSMNSDGQILNVIGGLTGTKIWLQIGDRGAYRQRTFQGTFIDGKLMATAQGHGLHTWTLEGSPTKH
jgi:hypothetical protein